MAVLTYRDRLLSSHDYRVHVDILTTDEQPVGTALLLDGQVAFQDRTNPIRRTANLTLVDPSGALDVRAGATWNGSGLWLNRLVRLRHTITVAGVSQTTTFGVFTPTQIAREGPVVTADFADKMQLALTGVQGYTYKKGTNAVAALKGVMRRAGETRFRIPSSSRVLSRDYSVGLQDEAAPGLVALAIAHHEFNQELLFDREGYLLMRPQPQVPVFDAGPLWGVPQSSASLTDAGNYWKVLGGKVSRTVGSTTTTTQAQSIVQVRADNDNSPRNLQRGGVDRLLPKVFTEDSYRTTSQTAARALLESKKSDGPVEELNISAAPLFDREPDDIVTVRDNNGGSRDVRLSTVTLPILPTDEGMSVGFHTHTGKHLVKKPSRTYRRTRTRARR